MAREGSGDRSPVNQEEIKFWRTKWDALRFQYPQTTKYAITSAGSAILGAILLRKHEIQIEIVI